MTNLFSTYHRWPFALVDGSGWELQDDSGKTYTDLTSGIGVMSMGYHNAAVQAAVEDQVQHLWHASNLYESPLSEAVAAKLVAGLQPESGLGAIVAAPEYLVFFGNSGTEANEAALKLARRYTCKTKIMNFAHAFHGRTYGSLTVTPNPAIQKGFGIDTSDVVTATYNADSTLALLDDTFAAVIIESVQGEGGVYPADKTWYQALVAKAQSLGVLVIVDEVQTGIGRTGSLFAFQQFGITPDIITSAKALGGGLPVGAMIGKKTLASAFPYGAHGTTFGGNPVVMASANATLANVTPELLADVQAKSAAVFTATADWPATVPAVTGVRGLGLMIGIELTDAYPVADVLDALHEQGILALSARGNTLRLLPPLVISSDALVAALATIKATLNAMVPVNV